MWMAAAPPIGMGAPGEQSGQVLQAVVAPSPRTYAPERRSRNVPAAAATAIQVKAVGRASDAPVLGQRSTIA